ncbi:MAG: hypothetical protein ACTSYM_09025 [Candidatus Baldrarchaeia archaeon]
MPTENKLLHSPPLEITIEYYKTKIFSTSILKEQYLERKRTKSSHQSRLNAQEIRNTHTKKMTSEEALLLELDEKQVEKLEKGKEKLMN